MNDHGLESKVSFAYTIGYRGRMVSFEPLREAFGILQQTAARDPLWESHNIAFGDRVETAKINISANSYNAI